MKTRYTPLPASCRREREQEDQSHREFLRWYDAGIRGPWRDAAEASICNPRGGVTPFSRLYDAEVPTCS